MEMDYDKREIERLMRFRGLTREDAIKVLCDRQAVSEAKCSLL